MKQKLWSDHMQMNLHMFHSSISAFGSTVDEPGAQGSHVFKLKTSRSHFSLSENLNDRIYMLTAQRASELHPGWVPFTSSLRLLCALVSHTQQQQFCVLCFQTCALNSALFKFNSASDEQLKFRQKKKKKTNPLQGAATMTEYVQVINPHYTTRSTGPISRGYVWGGCGRGVFRSGTRSQWGQEGVPTTTERRSASAQTQHTFRWRWSSSGSRATQKEQRLNRGSGGFLHLGGGDRWPTAPASFGGNYCSYTFQARAPSDSHNRCDWTTFLSDHLSPAHQHGKCAH